MPCLAGNNGGFQEAFLRITIDADALGEEVVRHSVVLIYLHSGGFYPQFQPAVFRLNIKHIVHSLQGDGLQVQFFSLGEITLAGIYDESKRQSACYHRKYVIVSH